MNAAQAWRLRDTVAGAALFLATAAFTLWQNSRVAVLWDLSFLLDTSYRLSLGQVPYRDFAFSYAPLTFLLHAAIIGLAGRVYFLHIVYAALAGGAATLLCWRILLRLLEPRVDGAWRVAALLSAPLVFLGIYGVYPHPIYDSDCVLAVLAALCLLQRGGEGRVGNGIAGAACVVPLFFKQNIGLFFLLAALAAVAAIAIARRMERAGSTGQLWFFAGAASGLAFALLALHATVGLHNYLYWTITFAAQRRLPGLGVVLSAYRQSSLLWTIPAAIVALALLHVGRLRERRWARLAAVVLLGAPFLWTITCLAFSGDPSDRAAQLLSLWPQLLILGAVVAICNLRPQSLRANPTLETLLPFILLATIHGAFLSQQLWGSTYAIWPLLMLLIASLLLQVPAVANPVAAIVCATLLICGGLYATSHDRLSYANLDGAQAHATLPELRGMTTPGPWIPAFEELVRETDAEIPAADGVLLIPGEDPFYFATGRAPQFPVLLFDPAVDPYSPQQTLDEVRLHKIGWLIVKRDLQLNGPPDAELPEILGAVEGDFTLYRTLSDYEIYRRR